MKYLTLLLLSLIGQIAQADDWFCRSQLAKRSGNVYSVCGVGLGYKYTDAARYAAYHSAQLNFESICLDSADCRHRKVSVEPLRTECVSLSSNYERCYQMIEVTVLEK